MYLTEFATHTLFSSIQTEIAHQFPSLPTAFNEALKKLGDYNYLGTPSSFQLIHVFAMCYVVVQWNERTREQWQRRALSKRWSENERTRRTRDKGCWLLRYTGASPSRNMDNLRTVTLCPDGASVELSRRGRYTREVDNIKNYTLNIYFLNLSVPILI